MDGPIDIGVGIVSFRSEAVIEGCLDSLFASQGARVRAVVVDNASPDGTVDTIRKWAAAQTGRITFAEHAVGEITRATTDLTLLHAPVNGGFAYGTNRAFDVLLGDPEVDLFWMLNPDCQVLPCTAAHFVQAGSGGAFSLMGGRVVYLARPDLVQTDGGHVSLLTGVVRSANGGCVAAQVRVPPAEAIDFISGASAVASRQFIEQAGLMVEDYFVYYEEVDWAMRRGNLPLRQAPAAIVHHHGGTSLASGSFDRRPSAFSNYFNYRNRIRFLSRFSPGAVPVAVAYALAKGAQLALLGAFDEARGVFAGALGLPPPRRVRDAVAGPARPLAFGRFKRSGQPAPCPSAPAGTPG